ncbi:MAG: DciA family protein [Betaproteobacteria bacterium]
MRLPKLDRILSAESELQPLVVKARELRALAGLVEVFLSPDLARQARVANFKDGELVLSAANAAAAAKFRLLAPALSRFLSERRWQVKSVSVRVQPRQSRAIGSSADAAVHQKPRLSANTLKTLRELHAGMADSPAREALAALIKRQTR